MHRLVYISTASSKVSPYDVNHIERTSKLRNTRDAITGVLFWSDRTYFQLIEGPKPLVDATIGRIQLDIRHFGLRRLSYRAVSEPICADWAMGCHPIAQAGHLTNIFDAENIDTVYARMNSFPDPEFDIFLRSFYQTCMRD